MQTQSETVGERTVNHETELWSQKSVLTYQHLKVKFGSGTILKEKWLKSERICLFWCGLSGYDRWGLLTVTFCRKHRPGQWLPMWEDRLSCWCQNFLEVRARQDWNDSLHLLLTWNICRDTLLRWGDSMKYSADTCGRPLLLLSHQQSHFHRIVFQCHLIFLLYLAPVSFLVLSSYDKKKRVCHSSQRLIIKTGVFLHLDRSFICLPLYSLLWLSLSFSFSSVLKRFWILLTVTISPDIEWTQVTNYHQ